jgi:hypothetical protein
MSVNGIGKQVAPSVDCTTHDCFILRFFYFYHIAVGAIQIAPNHSYWRFIKADLKQAEQ